jgi:hypothetical protein
VLDKGWRKSNGQTQIELTRLQHPTLELQPQRPGEAGASGAPSGPFQERRALSLALVLEPLPTQIGRLLCRLKRQPGVLQIWEFLHRSSLQHLDNYTSLFIQLTSAPANRDATSLFPAQRISRDLLILPRYPEVQVQPASLHHPNFELRCANCKRAIRPYIDPLAHREPVLESQQ